MIRAAIAAACLVGTGCTTGAVDLPAADEFLTLRGPYFGQTPPGAQPRIFMPGIVSTTDFDGCVAFLLDGHLCVFSSVTKGTRFSYERDGRWTPPQPAPWQNERGVTDFTAGPDGKTLFFQTSRPTSVEDTERDTNIWVVQWAGSGWGEARPLPSPPNSEEVFELYPSVSEAGSVYFFTSPARAARAGEIFRSVLSDGAHAPAEPLPDPVNSPYHEVDPVIAPDGSYLLFGSGRPGGYTFWDLYVSFRREDGSWTAPVNGGQTVNGVGSPIRMGLTPDGKYLFFPSTRETDSPKGAPIDSPIARRWGDADVYWVSTDFLRELEGQVGDRPSAATVFIREYRSRGLSAALGHLAKLLEGDPPTHYLELSELLAFCGELVAEGRLEEADELGEALVASLGEELRIRQGYAAACILNGRTAHGLGLLRRLWQQYPTAPSRSDTELWLLAYELSQREREDDELAVHRFVTEEFPDSEGAWLDLARAYERRGELDLSREACAQVLELDPVNAEAVELLERLERSP